MSTLAYKAGLMYNTKIRTSSFEMWAMLYHYSAVPLGYGSILEIGVRKIKPGERDTGGLEPQDWCQAMLFPVCWGEEFCEVISTTKWSLKYAQL